MTNNNPLPQVQEEWDAPGTAKDWEEFTSSPIGRWLRRYFAESLAEAQKQLVFTDPAGVPRLQGIGEVLYNHLEMLDSIPQSKVESERETAENGETETDDAD